MVRQAHRETEWCETKPMKSAIVDVTDLLALTTLKTHGSCWTPTAFSAQHMRVPKSCSVVGVYRSTEAEPLKRLPSRSVGTSNVSPELLTFQRYEIAGGSASTAQSSCTVSPRAAPTVLGPGPGVGSGGPAGSGPGAAGPIRPGPGAPTGPVMPCAAAGLTWHTGRSET